MSLNKNRIIKDVHKFADLSGNKSAKIVEATLEIIKKTLESNENVVISGFGKFFIKDNSKRRGLRQKDNNAYIPDVRKVVTFKCSPVLVKKINEQDNSCMKKY